MATKTKPGSLTQAGNHGTIEAHAEYRCLDCGHEWRAHTNVKQCANAKCQSLKIERTIIEPRNPLGHTDGVLGLVNGAARKARNGARLQGVFVWHCEVCERDFLGPDDTTHCDDPKCNGGNCTRIEGPLSVVEAGRRHMSGKLRSPSAGTTNGTNETNGRLRETKPAAGETTAAAGDTFAVVPIDEVQPSPHNPRKTFDEKSIDEMAAGMRDHGIVQPIRVLPAVDGVHEIVDGERRWRAAKKAGLTEVPVLIRSIEDQRARIVRLIANLQREDMNAIDQARGFRDACEAGCKQTELAAQLGMTQGAIANKMRLLALPDEWLQRIISGEITEGQARELVAWAKYPAVLEALATDLKHETMPVDRDTFEEALGAAVCENSRPMAQRQWHQHTRQFKTSRAIEKELDIVELKGYHDSKRAMNVERWEELQKAATAKKKKRHSAAVDDEDEPAERRETPAERKARAEKQKAIFAKKLYGWKIRWLQTLCAKRIGQAADSLVFKWLLYFTVQGRVENRREDLGRLIRDAGGKSKDSDYQFDAAKSLGSLKGDQFPLVARAALQAWVQHDVSKSSCDIDPADIETLAGELGIDVAKEWTLSIDFLELHNTQQLAALAVEWKQRPIPESAKRSVAINLILNGAAGKPPKCPAELLKCKPVRLC